MALSKIIEISNIGRLVECKSIELSNVNLIYAENGCGKSTLSAVLRALPHKNSVIIDERSTLGNKKKPKVKLLFDGKHFVSYENGTWNGDSPRFEVFDDIFVSENIYAGHEINSDHRAGLYEFAIGSLAVDLRNEEKKLDTEIQEIDAKRKQLRDGISKNIEVDFEEFIKLPSVDELEKKIRETENQIKAAQSGDLIQKQQSLSKLDEVKIDFGFYGELLKRTIDDISDNAEKFVKQHIADHMDLDGTDTENWLETGLHIIRDENCPFCGQSLSELNILKLYRDYFNNEYKQLKDEIASAIVKIEKLISDNILISLQKLVDGNQELINTWSEHIDKQNLSFAVDDFQVKWQGMREELVSLLDKKQKSPLEPIKNVLSNIISIHTQIVTHVEKYNLGVEEINKLITEFKAQIANADINQLQAELKRLKHIQKRFNDFKDNCEEYQTLGTKRDKLDQKRKNAKDDLNKANDTILKQYQVDMNQYLQSFGVDFRINNNLDRKSKGKPRLMLKVVINDEEVDISNNEKGRPNFKNTLSTGDKTTLALAFFFAKLKQMGQTELKETIVVLDDPITSLGMHRRERTANEISKLASQVKQIVVLSHEPYFLRNIYKKLKLRSINPKLIQLQPRKNETVFITWDMFQSLKQPYVLHCEKLIRLIDGEAVEVNELINIRNSIRIVIEGALQNRYPTDLSENDSLGQHIAKIVNSTTSSPLSRLKTKTDVMNILNEVNQYSTTVHHLDSDTSLTYQKELIAFCKDVLSFVHGELG